MACIFAGKNKPQTFVHTCSLIRFFSILLSRSKQEVTIKINYQPRCWCCNCIVCFQLWQEISAHTGALLCGTCKATLAPNRLGWNPKAAIFLGQQNLPSSDLPRALQLSEFPHNVLKFDFPELGTGIMGGTYCKLWFGKYIGFFSLEWCWQIISLFFKCFNELAALLLPPMMKARSLVYLTPCEIETTFNFSGKTSLEILCRLLGSVLLMENWRFCSGVVKVRLSSRLIYQNFVGRVFR